MEAVLVAEDWGALTPAGRPRSLGAAAAYGLKFGDRDAFLREFLDAFYVEEDSGRRAAMLEDEPQITEDDGADAYYAAVAEHLALTYRLPVPPWTAGAARFLKRPFFPSGLESLKATLLVESPTAFRRRMIFVDANPLYRPRRDKPHFGT